MNSDPRNPAKARPKRVYVLLAITAPVVVLAFLVLIWMDKQKSPFSPFVLDTWGRAATEATGQKRLTRAAEPRDPPELDLVKAVVHPPQRLEPYPLPEETPADVQICPPLRAEYRMPYGRKLDGEWVVRGEGGETRTRQARNADDPLAMRELLGPPVLYQVVVTPLDKPEYEVQVAALAEPEAVKRALAFLKSVDSEAVRLRGLISATESDLLAALREQGHLVDAKPPASIGRTVLFRANEWQSPLLALPVDGPRLSHPIEVRAQAPASVSVYRRSIPPPPKSVWEKASADMLTAYAKSRSLADILQLFWTSGAAYKTSFDFYAFALGIANLDYQTSAADRDILLGFAAALTTREGGLEPLLTKIEADLSIACADDYHYTYGYCYFLLDCVNAFQLLAAAKGVGADLTGYVGARQALLKTIRNCVDRIMKSIDATGAIGHLVSAKVVSPGRRADRSIAILAVYALWKAEDLLRSGLDISIPEPIGAPNAVQEQSAADLDRLLADILAKRKLVVGYVCDDKEPYGIANAPGRFSVSYFRDGGGGNQHLFSGWLMCMLSVPERRAEVIDQPDRLGKFLTPQQIGWVTTSSNTDFHYWYELVYYVRALEILASEEAVGSGSHLDKVVQPLVNAIQGRLTATALEGLTGEYCTTYFMICQDTMLACKSLIR